MRVRMITELGPMIKLKLNMSIKKMPVLRLSILQIQLSLMLKERERVRLIVQEWRETGVTDHSSIVPGRSGSPRAEWLGETERERVRIMREWVQMTSQQRGLVVVIVKNRVQPFMIKVMIGQVLIIRMKVNQSILEGTCCGCVGGKLYLTYLLGPRGNAKGICDFYRYFQSLLRGRFLRNEGPVEEERLPSVASSELVQLRQHHTVSGLREGFRSRLENIVRGQVSSQHENSSNNNTTDVRSYETHANTPHESGHENQEQAQSLV